MRDIKFRSWNVVDKTMYNSIYNCKDSFEMQLKHPQIYKIMQYTGLKDVNGIEIYEGDIVERRFMNLIDGAEFVGVVKYYDGAFNVDNNREAYPLFHEIDEIEILGNIYEDSGLLEGINND